MRNYKKVSKCPDSLDRIINAVNNLPKNPEMVMQRLIELATNAISESSENYLVNSFYYRARIFELKLKDEVWGYLNDEILATIDVVPIAVKFKELVSIKSVLQAIAKMNADKIFNNKSNMSKALRQRYEKFQFDVEMLKIGANYSGSFTLDNGFIRPDVQGFALALSENISPERIRSCPKCQNLFWAKKLNSETCGNGDCVSKAGSRQYYNKKKINITERKRKKYYEKRGVEFCPVCVRPLKTHEESECQLNTRSN